MISAIVLVATRQTLPSLPFSFSTMLAGALIFLCFGITPYWRIVTKAGYSGLIALLFFVPILNIGMLFWFAYAEWPIERQAARAEMRPGNLPW